MTKPMLRILGGLFLFASAGCSSADSTGAAEANVTEEGFVLEAVEDLAFMDDDYVSEEEDARRSASEGRLSIHVSRTGGWSTWPNQPVPPLTGTLRFFLEPPREVPEVDHWQLTGGSLRVTCQDKRDETVTTEIDAPIEPWVIDWDVEHEKEEYHGLMAGPAMVWDKDVPCPDGYRVAKIVARVEGIQGQP